MAAYTGGMTVKTGYYLNRTNWELTPLKRGEVLKGTEADRYVRIPALLMLVVAPFLGAAFAMFLPFIGFVMLFGFAMKKIAGEHMPTVVQNALMGKATATAAGPGASMPRAGSKDERIG